MMQGTWMGDNVHALYYTSKSKYWQVKMDSIGLETVTFS